MVRVATSPEGITIQITKRTDGGTVLSCVTPDGTTTWQKSENRQAAFFPLHDLTHYAVESVLETKAGFFGLIANGWSIDDTTGKGAMGPLPPQSIAVERLVGLLDVERATASSWTADEFVGQLTAVGVDPALLDLTDAKLNEVRDRRRDLFAAWAAVVPGQSLDLSFPPVSDTGIVETV